MGHQGDMVGTIVRLLGCGGICKGLPRPDNATDVHKCARFCNDSKLSHEWVIRIIGKYEIWKWFNLES